MAAVVAAAALGMGLMGSDGDSDETHDPALTVPTPTPTVPQADSGRPQISSKPVTAAPRPTGEVAAAPTRTKTAAPRPSARTVPNVVGLSVGEAGARLAASGYTYGVVCQGGRPTGKVASQQPAAGQQWALGGRVALFVPDWRCRGEHPGQPWDDDD